MPVRLDSKQFVFDHSYTPEVYPQTFKAGDSARVFLCAESMAQKPSDTPDENYAKYPIQDYQGQVVQVVKRLEDGSTRETYPDREGLVECYLPRSYSYTTSFVDDAGKKRTRKHVAFKMPILYSALVKETTV